MKSLRVFICIIMIYFGLFGMAPETASAELSQANLEAIKADCGGIFTPIRTQFGNSCRSMADGVYAKLRNDPEVNFFQFKKYVMEGIPGSTKANEKGLIPFFQEIISKADGGASYISEAKIALTQAQTLARNSQIQEEASKGIITKEEERKRLDASLLENSKQTGTERANRDVEKVGVCAINFSSDTELSIGACINDAVTWLIKNTFLQIAGFLVWLTANMFNYSIQLGILQFSQWAPDTLYPIWIIVRQIISLVIVFVGLYLGFMYIIGQEDKFEKYIPWVIIFALFVNFSYPLVRTAIDISNIVSLKIYASAVGNDALNATITSKNTAGALIMDRLGLGGLMASATSVADASKGGGMLGNINSIPGALLAVVFALYAAYIFFIATLIMIGRTASLVFLIVASPILFVDSVLPVLGEKAKWLRKIFFEQLAVAPVFMIMLALTLKFLEVFSVSAKLNAGNISTISNSGVGSITTFFNILMMLIMLHIMIKVTKDVGGAVGEYATKTLGQVGGFGLGAATAGAGLIGRGVLGRVAAKARDSTWVERNQDNVRGRLAYNLSNSLAKSSFDLRNSKVVAKGAGMTGLSGGLLGVGMGTGSKSNFDEMEKSKTERIKAREARIKTRFERDVLKKDSNGKIELDEKGLPVVLHKKGDIDPKGLEAKERFITNKGGALFLTKKQNEELNTKATEELSQLRLEKYKKVKGSKEKEKMFDEMVYELAEIGKTDKNYETAQAQALAKALHIIQEERDSFDKEVKNHKKKLDEITDENEKRKYLNRLSEDMYTEITGEKKNPSEEGQQVTKEITPGDIPQASAFAFDTSKFNTNELDKAGLAPNTTTSSTPERGEGGAENQAEGIVPIPPKNNPGSTGATQINPGESFDVTKQSLINNNFAETRRAKQAANLAKHGLGQPVPEPKPSGAVVVRPTSSQNNQMSGDQVGRVAAAIGGVSAQKDRNSIPNDAGVIA